MKRLLGLGMYLLMSLSLAFAESKIRGEYEVLGQAPKPHSLEKVLFEEFMNFGCPHCNHFFELSKEMKAKYKGKVEFVDMPVLFQGQEDHPLRLYYVAKSVGKEELVKEELFKSKFKYGVNNFDPGIVNYLAKTLGLGELYQKEGQRDWVNKAIKDVEQKSKQYSISSTPTIVLASSLKMGPGKSMETFVETLPQTLDDLLK